MASVNRHVGIKLWTQADYDCQECGRPETPAMKKRVEDYARPTCDECIERLRHEGHGPGSGMMVYSTETTIVREMVNGKLRTSTKVVEHPPVPIEKDPNRCLKCFPDRDK